MCGGLIHPIAGRCKHCKGDLSALRSNRPAAAASLPALLAAGNHIQVTPRDPQPNGNGHTQMNGHAASAYAPAPQAAQHVAMPMPMADGAQPVLPPRPTGRMYAAAPAAGSAWWKSWPLVVIILALAAIVVAVILMVLPPGGKDKGVSNKGAAPPPAPERMDTNPLPPSQPSPPRAGDPWSAPKPDPLPKRDLDIPDDPDPNTQPQGGATNPSGTFGNLGGSGAMMMSMMRHACDRAATCGPLDSTLKSYCEMAKTIPSAPPSSACPAAKRCLDHIDEISCSTKFDDVGALLALTYKLQDCVEAQSC